MDKEKGREGSLTYLELLMAYISNVITLNLVRHFDQPTEKSSFSNLSHKLPAKSATVLDLIVIAILFHYRDGACVKQIQTM